MERIPLRELRNHASRVVRRARAGERIVITVDGVPVAQIVPLDGAIEPTLEALIAQGRLLARRTSEPPQPGAPIRLPGSRTTTEVLDELRER